MNEQLHIIITGNSGKTVRLPLAKKKLLVYSISAVLLIVILSITSVFSVSLISRNRSIAKELASLQSKVENSDEVIAEIKRKADEEREKLNVEVASLREHNETQAAAFKEEKELLISTAVSELNERSGLIETIMDNIGVKVSDKENSKSQSSGGPFIEKQPAEHDALLYKADTYLKTIQQIPLGLPVYGRITSRFGSRKDPLNGKSSFHEGIDFRGKRGDKIYATADGIVKKAFKNGSYGNYVVIDHLNGYTTSFAHMQKYVVKKGDRVKRGQLIGQVGNTGRSTGPHLHYELLYKGKPVNPQKYIQTAKLTESKAPVKIRKSATPAKVVK